LILVETYKGDYQHPAVIGNASNISCSPVLFDLSNAQCEPQTLNSINKIYLR